MQHNGRISPNGRVSPNGRQSNNGRVSSGGRRSPTFRERTTTVRFVIPSTAKRMCTKLSRVVRTRVALTNESGVLENDKCLCENFLDGHCEQGHHCRLAHVPRQCLWEYLTPGIDSQTYFYEPGFSVRCYTPAMDVYYDIPSEYLFQTKGSEKYVELYNENGDNFREKFRLCPTMMTTTSCPSGIECTDIHPNMIDLSAFPCIQTHVASPETLAHYERLPADIVVRAHVPNTGEPEEQTYTGDDVLRTAGATQYEEAYRQEGGFPSVRMQHCAHFQNKKMCRLGDGCRFLHVVSLALASPMHEDNSARASPVNDRPISPMDRASAASVLTAPAPGLQTKNNAALAALAGLTGGMTASPYSNSPINYMVAAAAPESMAAPAHGNMQAGSNTRRSPVRRNNPYVISPTSNGL